MKPKNSTGVSKRHSIMQKNGQLRIRRTITSSGHIKIGDQVRKSFEGELPFKRFSKSQIAKIYTQKYVKDLVARAERNRKTITASSYECRIDRKKEEGGA